MKKALIFFSKSAFTAVYYDVLCKDRETMQEK